MHTASRPRRAFGRGATRERRALLVGSIELVPLVDAVGVLGELDELFPETSDWDAERERHPELFAGSQWRIPCTSYLIRSGGTTVLVDTGVGPAGLWGWKPEWEEGLLPALSAAGVVPADVDVVFLTHLHVDHVGWNTDRDGALVFPNARYVAHRDGVEFARGVDRPHIGRTITPVAFEEIGGETELVDGVTAFELPGHFPGHMGLRIESDGRRAILLADAAVNPKMLDVPDLVYVSDADPAACAQTRRELVEELVDQDILAVCGHYPARRHRPCRQARRARPLGSGVTEFREAFPILLVDDVAQASAFYCSTLGFEEAYRNEDEHGLEFVFLALEPYGIGIGRRVDGDGRDFALWIYADDVDAAAADLRAAGAEEILAPTDQPWGERMCSFVDPNGHLVHIGAKAE